NFCRLSKAVILGRHLVGLESPTYTNGSFRRVILLVFTALACLSSRGGLSCPELVEGSLSPVFKIQEMVHPKGRTYY
ncbi:MAG: hypothetical protein WCP55_05315, partial [Lentisphaerota bacterium]